MVALLVGLPILGVIATANGWLSFFTGELFTTTEVAAVERLARAEGYDEGEARGFDAGYADGYAAGSEDGYSDGYESGRLDGCVWVFDALRSTRVEDPYGFWYVTESQCY
jgi:hypothetical protein